MIPATPAARSALVACLIVFGFFARAATYRAPLLDHHGWRQADTASIARNFARERFNILYPQIDQRGARADGYVETGLEVFAFLVAAISKVAGFHTEIGRLLSAVCFVASSLLLWRFVRRRHGEEAGLIAVFLQAFAFPLLLYIERAFMNEALLISLSIGCLVAAQRYLETRGRVPGVALIALSSLIAAIKLPYLIIWAPVAGLFLEAEGRRVWRQWILWTMVVVNGGVAVLWYGHARALGAESGLSFGITDKLFDAATVFSVTFPLQMLERLARDILEPIGLVAIAVGAWLAYRSLRWCELLGLLGFVAYVVIVAVGNRHHNYYQLALMPIAPVVAAPGVSWIATWAENRFRLLRETALPGILMLAAICAFVRLVSAHSWFEYSPHDVVLCEALHAATSPTDRLLFVGDNNPQVLFCVDRKGWLLSDAESTEPRVRQAWQAGAKLAIVPRTLQRPDVRQVVSEWGPPVLITPTADVYRLR
jgi:hypothetical protein